MDNMEITFEILDHKKVLMRRRDGWAKEVNIVSWNGCEPKLDIRDWDPNHKRMTRGITLKAEDASKLIKILKKSLPSEKSFPKEGYECSNPNEVSFRILQHLGTITKQDTGADAPWIKEVNIVSWNGKEPKVDIRDWDQAHERMTRGIALSREEALRLSQVEITVPFIKEEPATERDYADEVIDRIVNYFIESPNAELERTAYGEVKVDCEDGMYILPLLFDGRRVLVTAKEA